MHRFTVWKCLYAINNLHAELFLSGLRRGPAGTSVLCTSAQLLYDHSKSVTEQSPACMWLDDLQLTMGQTSSSQWWQKQNKFDHDQHVLKPHGNLQHLTEGNSMTISLQ